MSTLPEQIIECFPPAMRDESVRRGDAALDAVHDSLPRHQGEITGMRGGNVAAGHAAVPSGSAAQSPLQKRAGFLPDETFASGAAEHHTDDAPSALRGAG